ncbi:MAG: LysR family transcriptional regulator [Proteobacteria bacterium]|nr:LysR family transcriptional regulator [Pseudomonadota bacterium]
MRKPTLQKRTASLEWDDLRCVLAIARAGSLSGAARALAVEHSTVFRRLNAIEKRLGVKLFQRTRGGYVPTESGEITAASASVMESQALDIERRIVGADERLSGVVRLATSELFAGYLLPQALKTFSAAHPDIEIEVDAASRIVDLNRREADVALRASTSAPEHFVGKQVGELRYAMYAAPEVIPPTPYNLSELPWLGFAESLSYLAIARWQRAQSARTPHVRFGSLASMMQAAAEGLGVAILPLFAAEYQPTLVRLGAALDQPRMRLWVLSHKEVRNNARVKALSRHLIREVPRVLSARQKIATRGFQPEHTS